MKGWYFSNMDCRLRFHDGREIKAGITHTVDCVPILCEQGLHASIRPIDALRYAPDCMVWRVELGGEIIKGDYKACATERTYLWGYDATPVLRKFARLCALDVVDEWGAPDIVREYLRTGDESKRDAAVSAARNAVRDAARDVARDAAWYAAWNAAWYAAWYAAVSAARDAVWDAARDVQNKRLYRMLMRGRLDTHDCELAQATHAVMKREGE